MNTSNDNSARNGFLIFGISSGTLSALAWVLWAWLPIWAPQFTIDHSPFMRQQFAAAYELDPQGYELGFFFDTHDKAALPIIIEVMQQADTKRVRAVLNALNYKKSTIHSDTFENLLLNIALQHPDRDSVSRAISRLFFQGKKSADSLLIIAHQNNSLLSEILIEKFAGLDNYFTMCEYPWLSFPSELTWDYDFCPTTIETLLTLIDNQEDIDFKCDTAELLVEIINKMRRKDGENVNIHESSQSEITTRFKKMRSINDIRVDAQDLMTQYGLMLLLVDVNAFADNILTNGLDNFNTDCIVNHDITAESAQEFNTQQIDILTEAIMNKYKILTDNELKVFIKLKRFPDIITQDALKVTANQDDYDGILILHCIDYLKSANIEAVSEYDFYDY